MSGTGTDRGRVGLSWLARVAIVLVAAVGLGAGVKLASFWIQGPVVEPGVDVSDAGYAFEDRWAVALRDGHPGMPCPVTAGAAGGTIQMGLTAGGRPWMGSPAPVLEIQEFTDYRCPDCRRANLKVRRLLSLFPDRVRVVYRHLPMDPSCNPAATTPIHDRACELARIAVCAARQGRFWEAHDYLLQNADAVCAARRCAVAVARGLDLDEDAFRYCMEDPSAGEIVARDVAEARELGIRVTPTFLIGGRIFEKAIPDEALAPLRARLP